MKFILITGLVFIFCSQANAVEDEPATTIPLDQIWGYHLPGTRDVVGIPFPEQPEGVGQTFATLSRQREYNIEQIRQALAMKPPAEMASPGFVLPAPPDSRTLMGVPSSLRGKTGPFQRTFRVGDEFTLVFFSHPSSYYVHLRKVERQENEITVYYQFEPHFKPEATVHFALIPLGKLPAGDYRVTYEQIPIDEKYRAIGFEPVHPEAAETVCRDFSFRIIDLPPPDESAEGAMMIPLHRIWAYDMPGTREVRELEPQHPDAGRMSQEEFIRRHRIQQILHSLSSQYWPKVGENAGPAFVVVGTGKEALKNATAVLNKEKRIESVFPTDRELTLIFYSYSCARYVHISSVEQSEKLIIVKYQIVAHPELHMTTHFALIPLGKLPEGVVQVEMVQVESSEPFDLRVHPLSDPLRYVSGSFSFEVRK